MGEGWGRGSGRVGSDYLSAIAGRVGSGQRFAGSGRVGSKKSDPWTTLLWPSGIDSRLGRNRLWVRFLAVSDIYPMFIEPTITWVLRVLWVHMAWHKNCVKKKNKNKNKEKNTKIGEGFGLTDKSGLWQYEQRRETTTMYWVKLWAHCERTAVCPS